MRKDTRRVHARRRLGALAAAVVVVVVTGVYVSASVGRSGPPRTADVRATSRRLVATRARVAPRLLVTAPGQLTTSWKVVAQVRGKPAAWIASSGVTLMRFAQSLVHLTLHAGSSDGGVSGWTYGNRITPREIHLLIAAVNGGFKLTYRNVGFSSGGHVAVALKAGLASIVTYTDGTTDIGTWQAGVPSSGKKVFSVLQNQRLLVDHGIAAASVSNCLIACWGETIGSRTFVARSGLGIDASGQLVWAAAEHLSPAGLATALIGGGAVRAIELDINPVWVAGYLYVHHTGGPSPVPVVPGQLGLAGELLVPYSRDFLAIVAN
jgi:hypothetical protein